MLEPKTKQQQQQQQQQLNPASPGPNKNTREKPTLPRTRLNTSTNQAPEPTTNHPLSTGTKPPDRDTLIPDGDTVEKRTVPETKVNTRKPPKLKPKVVQVPDIKFLAKFLAKKRKERDLKLNLVRGTDLLNYCDKPSGITSDSATLPPTLPPNSLKQPARRTPDMKNAALYTENREGDKKISANVKGIPDLSGLFLLARYFYNLGV